MGMKQIVVEDVCFAYDDAAFALEDISFKIQEKEGCILLVGKNGAGKSTLINLLCGCFKPAYGSVQRENLQIAYLPFDSPLYKHLTILENMRFYYRNFQGKNLDIDDPFVQEVIQALSIDYLLQRFDQCSSGQQQKASIACILLSGADLIIMDEPFVAIDTSSVARLIELISKMRKDTTFVVTTHTITKLEPFADRLLYLNESKLEMDTTNVQEIQAYFKRDDSI